MTIEFDGHVYHEDLLYPRRQLAKGGDEMLEKNIKYPKSRSRGGKQDGPVIKTANGARSGMIRQGRPRNNLRDPN